MFDPLKREREFEEFIVLERGYYTAEAKNAIRENGDPRAESSFQVGP
jgi:hypothetical protein